MPHPANRLNTVRLCRGQTKVLTVAVKAREGTCANLNGATIYFTVRESTTGPVIIGLISPDGIEITDALNGKATITIASDLTNIDKGCYRYDIWVEYPGSPPERHCVVKFAEFIVEDAITAFVSP